MEEKRGDQQQRGLEGATTRAGRWRRRVEISNREAWRELQPGQEDGGEEWRSATERPGGSYSPGRKMEEKSGDQQQRGLEGATARAGRWRRRVEISRKMEEKSGTERPGGSYNPGRKMEEKSGDQQQRGLEGATARAGRWRRRVEISNREAWRELQPGQEDGGEEWKSATERPGGSYSPGRKMEEKSGNQQQRGLEGATTRAGRWRRRVEISNREAWRELQPGQEDGGEEWRSATERPGGSYSPGRKMEEKSGNQQQRGLEGATTRAGRWRRRVEISNREAWRELQPGQEDGGEEWRPATERPGGSYNPGRKMEEKSGDQQQRGLEGATARAGRWRRRVEISNREAWRELQPGQEDGGEEWRPATERPGGSYNPGRKMEEKSGDQQQRGLEGATTRAGRWRRRGEISNREAWRELQPGQEKRVSSPLF